MCEKCEGNGILGVVIKGALGDSIPITCSCTVGQNAKEANPTWLTEKDFE